MFVRRGRNWLFETKPATPAQATKKSSLYSHWVDSNQMLPPADVLFRWSFLPVWRKSRAGGIIETFILGEFAENQVVFALFAHPLGVAVTEICVRTIGAVIVSLVGIIVD